MKALEVILLSAVLAAPINLASVVYAQPPSCTVTITSQKPGAAVQISELVRGTTTTSPGAYFWVFAHREGLSNWWPQGGAPTMPKSDGTWAVLVTFGEPRDAGANFEIFGAWVDGKTNAVLQQYVKTTEESGRYPGIVMPATVCRSSLVTLQRR